MYIVSRMYRKCIENVTFSNIKQGCFTNLRKSKAIGKFKEMRQVLIDHKINIATTMKLMEARVRSRLLYGPQAWYIDNACTQKLETCWMELLREMVKWLE